MISYPRFISVAPVCTIRARLATHAAPADDAPADDVPKGPTIDDVAALVQASLDETSAAALRVTAKDAASPTATSPGDDDIAFDGDADRLVYFRLKNDDNDGSAELLDGDKIAALVATRVTDLLERCAPVNAFDPPLRVGVVQTAYANGASTAYVRDVLGVECACANTGVKFLHPVAETFDVGVYFEANGHGTAVFSDATIERLDAAIERLDAGADGGPVGSIDTHATDAVADASTVAKPDAAADADSDDDAKGDSSRNPLACSSKMSSRTARSCALVPRGRSPRSCVPSRLRSRLVFAGLPPALRCLYLTLVQPRPGAALASSSS